VIETEASLKGLQGVFSVGTRFNVIFGKPVELGDEVNLEGATKQARAHNFTEQGFIQTWRDGIAGSLYSREWSFLKQNSRGWLFQKRRQLRVKVLPAAVLGQKTSDRAWNELFRSSGAMHLFVVSGMHVGFVVLCFWVVMYFTPLSSRGILILSLFLVWFYAWVTGGHPPIFRAALVYSLISLGYLLRLRVHALNAVIVAFIIIVMMNRYSSGLPSKSYVCTWQIGLSDSLLLVSLLGWPPQ